MDKFVRFFVNNSRMNYVLFILVVLVGFYSYSKTPKEIFPAFELDIINVSGSYRGASIDMMDKIAVRDIEDELKSIEGIDEMASTITPGTFSITVSLLKDINKYDTSAKIKEAIDKVKQNFPEDMNDPQVTVATTGKSILQVSISSTSLSLSQLKDFAKKLRTKILSVPDISEVVIYGDSDMYYNIKIDEKKLDSFSINKTVAFNAISGLSYIFPVGKIEGKDKHYFISTYNGKKTAEAMQKTLLSIGGKKIYLSDIAMVEKRYEDSTTLSTFNGKTSLSLAVSQTERGNALVADENIKKLLAGISKQNPEIDFTIHENRSDRIKDRLNVVMSNIFFGLILVSILLAILINTRMAIIVALGIPTSFIMGAIYLYFFGYTINMVSLIGVLVALGIVVDDAIVVAENIQQKLEDGLSPKEAAIVGTQEMALPVFIASITTIFAFLPSIMIGGTMGEFIKLIPIAVSALIVASLIESFVFLPIHAAHTLKRESRVLSWSKANAIYSWTIHKLMTYKKTFLFLFIIIVPLLTVLALKNSKFQMFPKFDSTTMNISIKADVNTKIEDSFEIVDAISQDILKNKEKFSIKTISTISGFRKDVESRSERYPYVMYISLELHKLVPVNFVDKYITPYLSPYEDNIERSRTDTSQKVAKKLRKFLIDKDYKSQYKLKEIFVAEQRAGPVKSDIKIGVISNNTQHTLKAIKTLKDVLHSIEGVKTVSDTAKMGIEEIKIKINSYGEQLGLDEATIGQVLSNMFLSKKKSTAFDENSLLEIKVESLNKNSLQALKSLQVPLETGQTVELQEVVTFETLQSFEKVIKDYGEIIFYVIANVNPSVITSGEVVDQIKPVLEKLKAEGVDIELLGEKKKKAELLQDMLNATGLALFLIMLSMLYLFNSFKDTFTLMSVIPFSFLGVLAGHYFMGLNLSMPSLIGALGLAGVVINDGIIMMTYLKKTYTLDDLFTQSIKRLRPIFMTTLTTMIGLMTLIFFATGQAIIFQPLAISLGYGLAWGTILNLLYVPTMFALLHSKRFEKNRQEQENREES